MTDITPIETKSAAEADVNAAFDSILIALTSQKYDVGTSAFSASAERAKVVDFVTYGAGGSGIAVPKGNPKALSMDPMTLCGRTVAAQKGTIQGLDYLPKFSADCTAAGKAAITAHLYFLQLQVRQPLKYRSL